LSPRRETGCGLFDLGFLNRTAVRISRAFMSPHDGALTQQASAAAPPSEPSAVDLNHTGRNSMTAYLISLALAGLVAIAVWEGLS
jgi:hypothetical protein